jgi:magnesium-transporting ATPase (P-type)
MSQDAAKTSYRQKEHGVRIKIITGDNEVVTRKICKEVGLAIENATLGKDEEVLVRCLVRGCLTRAARFRFQWLIVPPPLCRT